MIRGITLGLYNRWGWINPNGTPTPGALAAIDNIVACNATHAILCTSIQQATITSETISYVPWNPTPVDFGVIAQACRDRGLNVGLKIHVDPMDGNWRHLIWPADLPLWKGAYQPLIESFANYTLPNPLILYTEQENTALRDTNQVSAWRTHLINRYPWLAPVQGGVMAIGGNGLWTGGQGLNGVLGYVGASIYPSHGFDGNDRADIANHIATSSWYQDAINTPYIPMPTEWDSSTPVKILAHLGAFQDLGITNSIAWYPPDTPSKQSAYRTYWT